MQIKEQTSKEYFNGLTIIHAALLIGQVLFACVAYYLNSNEPFSNNSRGLNDVFQIVAPIFVVGGIMGSTFLTIAQLKSIKERTTLPEKLGSYRAVHIVKLALLEGPSLFAIVCYLLTANYLFLGLAGLIIVIFLINWPTRDKVAKDLELNQTDRARMEDPEAVVAVAGSK